MSQVCNRKKRVGIGWCNDWLPKQGYGLKDAHVCWSCAKTRIPTIDKEATKQ